MRSFIIDGFFNERQCEKIKERLQGKTYMNFNIEYSNQAGNCTILVCANADFTEEEIKEMFYYTVLCELAK